jgi:hypothetical protein
MPPKVYYSSKKVFTASIRHCFCSKIVVHIFDLLIGISVINNIYFDLTTLMPNLQSTQ